MGMTKPQIFFKVVLMQVVKRITAPIGNEIITLVKDTSLASVIAIPEILMNAKDFQWQDLYGLFSIRQYSSLRFADTYTPLFVHREKTRLL